MKPILEIHRLGRIPYTKALGIQQNLFDRLRSDQQRDIGPGSARNSLLLLEHEPVYTVGIRSQQYNNDYVDKLKDKLAQHRVRADFVHTNRGGLITFHGPGQLVAYPIINLGHFGKSIPNKSVKSYVKKLEDTIIDTLARVGLCGAHTVHEYPGVWLEGGDRKIAFVGITCKRYVTMHGISINCDCDLSWFEHIVSCGIEGKAITSVRHEMAAKRSMMVKDSQTDEEVKLSDGPKAVSSKMSNQEDLVCGQKLEYGVEHVADAFCLSFSQQFECDLLRR